MRHPTTALRSRRVSHSDPSQLSCECLIVTYSETAGWVPDGNEAQNVDETRRPRFQGSRT